MLSLPSPASLGCESKQRWGLRTRSSLSDGLMESSAAIATRSRHEVTPFATKWEGLVATLGSARAAGIDL